MCWTSLELNAAAAGQGNSLDRSVCVACLSASSSATSINRTSVCLKQHTDVISTTLCRRQFRPLGLAGGLLIGQSVKVGGAAGVIRGEDPEDINKVQVQLGGLSRSLYPDQLTPAEEPRTTVHQS